MDPTITVALIAAVGTFLTVVGTVATAALGYRSTERAKRRELHAQVISEHKRVGYIELVSTLSELIVHLQAYVYFAHARLAQDAAARRELVDLARAAADLPSEATPRDEEDLDRHYVEISAKTFALGRRMAVAFGKAAVVSSEATLMEDDADLERRLDGILSLVADARTDPAAFARLEEDIDGFNRKLRSLAVKLGADLRQDFLAERKGPR